MNCPICKSSTNTLYPLNQEQLLTHLAAYFHVTPPSDVIGIDYELRSCSSCTLEFSNPMKPGTAEFYTWITNQDSYYPSSRWEYKKVVDFIGKENNDTSLLDVGCGYGEFLEMHRDRFPEGDILGLETTADSYNRCIDKGLPVFSGYLDDLIDARPGIKFGYITAFHVLEHVPDPIAFCKEMVALKRKGGSIFLSTPFSPMFFESDWFDILNHPPHHMTRWNIASYKALASALSLRIEFYYPEALSLAKRIFITIKLLKDRDEGFQKSSFLKKMSILIDVFRNQNRRKVIDNHQIQPDVILVRLY